MGRRRKKAVIVEPIVVLAVDDEPLDLQDIEDFLIGEGDFAVLTEKTAELALDMAFDQPIDLVLVNIELKGSNMDGVECVRELRHRGFKGSIFMMADDFTTDRIVDAAIAGADDFILKGEECIFSLEVREVIRKKCLRRRGSKIDIDAIRDSGLLNSRLTEDQIALLSTMMRKHYPTNKKLSSALGISEAAIIKRTSRIKERLEFENTGQIAALMMALRFLGRVYLFDEK